jgi:hypothetical protein
MTAFLPIGLTPNAPMESVAGWPDFPRSLKEFLARFRDDEACRKYLAACR